jgi:predicted  nucleic acid-binding Zn-ribbon protein
MQIDQRVSDIYKKVLRLAEQKEYYQKLCTQLQANNKELTEKLHERENAFQDILEKLEEAEDRFRSNTESEPKVKAQLKKKLEQHVKDIDDCIDWLKNI